MGNLLLHRFNPQIAELYGINAALIFQYIWYRSVKMAGGRYVAMTLDDICKQYPYLGRKQVRLMEALYIPLPTVHSHLSGRGNRFC